MTATGPEHREAKVLSRRRLLAFLLCALLCLGACGGAQGVPEISSPFVEADAAVFDFAADPLDRPFELHGRWRERWVRDLMQRVARADVVAVGEVETLRIDTDLDRSTRYRLIFQVERLLRGEGFETLELEVSEEQIGFESIRGEEDRILRQPYVAFVKWYRPGESEEGPIEAAWHLSPASDALLAQATRFAEQADEGELPASEPVAP